MYNTLNDWNEYYGLRGEVCFLSQIGNPGWSMKQKSTNLVIYLGLLSCTWCKVFDFQ